VSDSTIYRALLCQLLKLPSHTAEHEILVTVGSFLALRTFGPAIEAIRDEAKALEVAADAATKSGLAETGAVIRNRAGGMRRSLEILPPIHLPS
jgi:hypothetical protein